MKKMVLSFFLLIFGQKLLKNVPTIALIILHQSGAPPTSPNPTYNFFEFHIFTYFPNTNDHLRRHLFPLSRTHQPPGPPDSS